MNSKTKSKGCLISFEGGEGAGKTEQSGVIEKRLVAKGFEVVRLREPGGTVISEQIREVVLSAKNEGITDLTEVLLFQAARSQIYGEVVLPSLAKGCVVLMDRTSDSSLVYQGIVRGMGVDLIGRLNGISTQETQPDLTVLLDVSVETGFERCRKNGKLDRMEKQGSDFHQQVRDGYLKLVEEDKSSRWQVVDAESEFDEVSEKLWKIVNGFLTERAS